MSKVKDELMNCPVFLLGKAYQKAHFEFRKVLKPYGLTNLQHLVLETLVYEPGQTASDLGELLILDKATLSGVVQRLEESGWLERRPDGEDARIQRLYATGKAVAAASEMDRARKLFDEEFLAGFTSEERILFKKFLRDLVW